MSTTKTWRCAPRVIAGCFATGLLCAEIGSASGQSPAREVVSFAITTNIGSDRQLFVAGGHPDVGNWDPAYAAKLYQESGNVWTGLIGVQAGTMLDFKFVSVPTNATSICVSANANWIPPGIGNHSVTSVPAQPPAPYAGKTIYYYSGWTNVLLIYSTDMAAFTNAPMTRIGPGRTTNEYLYRIHGIGVPGGPLQFLPHDGGTNYDHAPYPGYGSGDYFTTLDVFFLQGGDVYNYWPPATVSSPSIITSTAISTHSPSPNRTMRTYLPRGYTQNAWKRYPVIYMHDGENVFSPGGAFGSWDADLIATREISQGRMREVIIVALNSTANRTREYLPPEDNSGGQGFGDVYAKFLQFDVKAQIDANYRTLTNRANTGTIGASSGGLIVTYLGWATNVFGQIGPFSPAYLISPNFNNRINVEPKQPIRIYTQTGTVGSPETLILASTWAIHDYFLKDGYVQNADLVSKIGCGDTHNEASWAKWLPDCYQFLFGMWDEPNLLAQSEHPPVISGAAPASGMNGVVVSVPMLKGRYYRLDRSSLLVVPSWQSVNTSSVEELPWAYRSLMDTNPPSGGGAIIYRVVAP